MGATILNGAKIGKGSLVGANALVTEGKEFPDNSLIVGAPAKAVRSGRGGDRRSAGSRTPLCRERPAVQEGITAGGIEGGGPPFSLPPAEGGGRVSASVHLGLDHLVDLFGQRSGFGEDAFEFIQALLREVPVFEPLALT